MVTIYYIIIVDIKGGGIMADVVIIGGGPAGMMAGIVAADKHNVVIIEKNEKLGKKMYITGKGRCNLTNAKDISEFFDYIPGNSNFLYSALYTFSNSDVMNFFGKLGLELKVERGDRVFPKSDKSSDVISIMESELKRKKVKIMLSSIVKRISVESKKVKSVILQDGSEVKADYYILATGGISYPQTGSTGEGIEMAKEMGHKITKLMPSLVPIEIEEPWIKELQGLSLKNVQLYLKDSKNRIVYSDFGEMLFTHFGLSGPIVLSGSRAVNMNKDLSAVINLKPALSQDELDKRLQKDFTKFANKNFKNSLDELLPQKLISVIITLSGIDPDKKVNLITREERKKLVYILQNFTLKVKGLRPIAEAIVTAGGIDVKNVNPSNMRSKIYDNLYFAGEMIDVDAYTGGFNMQIAFSTGYLAGSRLGEEE
jgi:predicted Rossmann fold flavoprotein